MKHYCEETEAVLRELKSTEQGLSAEEARARLEKNGPNKLKEGKSKSLLRRFLEQLADPMILILLAAAAVSAVLSWAEGDSFVDVFIILAVVLVNAVLGVAQESKAEKAIQALQQMSAAHCKVIRDGQMKVIPAEELVVGDVIELEAGDAVPADARLLQAASLKIEEAALTGESVPVVKDIQPLPVPEKGDVPLGDRHNMIYTGSSAVYGRGVAVVTATGMDTEMGKIAHALTNAQEGQTPLQRKLSQLSKVLTWVVLAVSVVVFAFRMLRAGSMSLSVVVDSLMIAVSLAVAAIPEGLAAVVTVVLSIGVTNMARRSAIIRKLTAVETLGCAQIICTDKTGTLTQNRMTVVEHFGGDEVRTAAAMALCSDAEIDEQGEVTGEPTEAALVAWAKKLERDKNELKRSYPRCGEAPFDSQRKMMSTLHRQEQGCIQFTKGAPDMVLDLCTSYRENGQILPMTEAKRGEILRANKDMADRALRVLACAERVWEQEPEDTEPGTLERELCFLGLAGMIDPVRPEVIEAMKQCRQAGIRPIMITGDHVDTASAIARQLGILEDGARAVTGTQLDAMDDETFEKAFRDISVYARVQPEHKTRIVAAWQKAGYVTSMTGDGVNDAPSIKTADIGVGMGITGTDVTKSAADMVLADDNFATIVSAVEEGRRIYDNIRKAIQFLLSANMSEVAAVFTAGMLGFTILQPVQLLWVNLITDTFPALALGVEKAEANVMRRKPRDAKAGVFAGGMGVDILYQGLMVAALSLGSYLLGCHAESGAWSFFQSSLGTTMAFVTMSLAEIAHAFNMRSQRGSIFTLKSRNGLLWLAALGSLLLTALVTEVPVLASAFGFTPLSLEQFGLALLLALAVIPVVELVKLIQRIGHRE